MVTFAKLFENVGGETAFLRSIVEIRERKLEGRRGDGIPRLTRELLNLSIVNGCAEDYAALAKRYAISITVDENGCPRHSYAGLLEASRVVLHWQKGSEVGSHTIGDIAEPTIAEADGLLKRAARSGFTAWLSLA